LPLASAMVVLVLERSTKKVSLRSFLLSLLMATSTVLDVSPNEIVSGPVEAVRSAGAFADPLAVAWSTVTVCWLWDREARGEAGVGVALLHPRVADPERERDGLPLFWSTQTPANRLDARNGAVPAAVRMPIWAGVASR
jgi:hypothetical protein